MKARRQFVMLMVVAAIGAFGFVPAHAANPVTCQQNANVTLKNPNPPYNTQYENLLNVDGGSGVISGTIVCDGADVSGTANLAGTFSFCKHPAHIASLCPNTAAQPPLDDVYTALGPTSVIAHINGQISFTLDSGVKCSFSILGHTVGVVAELTLNNFKCGTNTTNDNRFKAGPEDTVRAQALSEIIVDPNVQSCSASPNGLPKACFANLSFQGNIEAIDQ